MICAGAAGAVLTAKSLDPARGFPRGASTTGNGEGAVVEAWLQAGGVAAMHIIAEMTTKAGLDLQCILRWGFMLLSQIMFGKFKGQVFITDYQNTHSPFLKKSAV